MVYSRNTCPLIPEGPRRFPPQDTRNGNINRGTILLFACLPQLKLSSVAVTGRSPDVGPSDLSAGVPIGYSYEGVNSIATRVAAASPNDISRFRNRPAAMPPWNRCSSVPNTGRAAAYSVPRIRAAGRATQSRRCWID